MISEHVRVLVISIFYGKTSAISFRGNYYFMHYDPNKLFHARFQLCNISIFYYFVHSSCGLCKLLFRAQFLLKQFCVHYFMHLRLLFQALNKSQFSILVFCLLFQERTKFELLFWYLVYYFGTYRRDHFRSLKLPRLR